MRARTVRPALVLAIWIACAAVLHAADAVKPHVLLINDDGIDAPGIAALVDALAGSTTGVERSAPWSTWRAPRWRSVAGPRR